MEDLLIRRCLVILQQRGFRTTGGFIVKERQGVAYYASGVESYTEGVNGIITYQFKTLEGKIITLFADDLAQARRRLNQTQGIDLIKELKRQKEEAKALKEEEARLEREAKEREAKAVEERKSGTAEVEDKKADSGKTGSKKPKVKAVKSKNGKTDKSKGKTKKPKKKS